MQFPNFQPNIPTDFLQQKHLRRGSLDPEMTPTKIFKSILASKDPVVNLTPSQSDQNPQSLEKLQVPFEEIAEPGEDKRYEIKLTQEPSKL